MSRFLQDLQYSLRRLRKSPGFTAAAILSLALGIGANSAIFTAVNSLLLRPLPVEKPGQLVFFNRGNGYNTLSYPDYRDFRDRADALSGVAADRIVPISLSVQAGNNSRVWGYEATANYFELLGVKPFLGRFFSSADDDKPGAHPVLVLDYGCWRSRFAADPDIAGKTAFVNGLKYTILGVAPAKFHGTEVFLAPELWVPMSMQAHVEPGADWLETRGTQNIWIFGRLKPGVSMRQAEASINRVSAQIARQFPASDEGLHIDLSAPGLLGRALRGPVMAFSGVLMAVAGLVLLLACVNLAGMLLARATDRRKEIALRLALGASRPQIVRQLLTESLVLAVLGGAGGLLVSLSITDLFSSWHPAIDVPISTSLTSDSNVLLFAFLASLLATLLFGLAPALQATKTDLVPALKNEAVNDRLRRFHLRDFLVAAQIALSVVLVVSSVLVVRGLRHSLDIGLGFNPTHAVSVSLDLGLQGYDEVRGLDFQRRLLDQTASLPGVESAATANAFPLRLGGNFNDITAVGKPLPPPSKREQSIVFDVSPGYLKAAGTRLIAGRDLDSRDRAKAPLAALVNQTFARKLFPGENPVGQHFRFGTEGDPIEIAGIVEDGKYQSLGEDPTSAVFQPVAQHYNAWTTLVVRSPRPPDQLLASIRGIVLEIDPRMTIYAAGSLTNQLTLPFMPARIAAIVLGSFGVLAMALAATGVFALMAYSVSRRTREIGIRMALGARLDQVLSLVLRRTLTLWTIGAVLGTALALASARLFSAVFYGIEPRDPLTYALALALMAAVAGGACWYPARRAARIDPSRALRED